MEIDYYLKMHRRTIFYLLLFLLFHPTPIVFAQDNPDNPDNPVYIVQSGDTLGLIASRFGVEIDDLIQENEIIDPNSISAGAELIIPGFEGINGILSIVTVGIGETLQSLTLDYHLSIDQLSRVNRLTSPMEVYAGKNIIVPLPKNESPLFTNSTLEFNQSLIELAILHDTDQWILIETNKSVGSWDILPSESIILTTQDTEQQDIIISSLITNIRVNPLPLVQGKTTVIYIETEQPLDLTGSLAGNDLHFFLYKDNEYYAIQGIHALEEPGLTQVVLKGIAPNNQWFDYSQMLLLVSGNFGQDPPLIVDPITVEPSVVDSEELKVAAIMDPQPPTRFWEGAFNYPTDEPCINALFGNLRSYNGGAYSNFHTGVDFGVCANNLNVYSPAPGIIVFADFLTVRGNATIIDHGWGVYSGFWHQSEITVDVGDWVETGQIIGQIGNTGRSTGPHLHWDLWVNDVQVNPLDWLEDILLTYSE